MELNPFHKVTTYVAGQNIHLCILTVALLRVHVKLCINRSPPGTIENARIKVQSPLPGLWGIGISEFPPAEVAGGEFSDAPAGAKIDGKYVQSNLHP